MTDQPETLTLHTFFSSSCGQRVLIALALKGLPFTYRPLNIAAKEHQSAAFKALNPSGRIPVLEVSRTTTTTNDDSKDSSSNGGGGGSSSSSSSSPFVLSQSIAILEYLEERHPTRFPLLPPRSQPERRAKVRELVGIMASDCFPPTNSFIATKVKAIRGSDEDRDEFVRSVNYAGFEAYEKMLEGCGGRYSVGDEITLADVCLVAQMDVAGFYNVEFGRFPRVKALYDRLMELEAFRKSNWKRQVDTPEKYREA